MFCCFCIATIYTLDAQTGEPITQPLKQPVLIDDHLPKSLKMARDHFEHQRTSNSTIWMVLSEKQKNRINQIEEDRDKNLSELDMRICAKKETLKTLELSSNREPKLIEELKSALSLLAVERQNVITKAKDQIRAQLTKKQRIVYDN